MENFIEKHKDLLSIAVLFILCLIVYFCGIGSYSLMDVDETRYVSMARDMFLSKNYLTLYLNGEYFFEKPPLYFWSECLSFGIFGRINEFSARFPAAFYATLLTLFVYFTGKKAVSAKFGLISAAILATSIEFTILSRYAILDIVVTSLIGISVLSGFWTQFVQDKNKKYFWWLFYIFSGLAVMAKGIPGFVVPFGTMFFVTLFNKTFKQNFKISYIVPGIIFFLLIVLPWHMIMLNHYDPLFFNEYIMKHHINRFFSASEVNRKQPFYFYFITVLWGAMPYVLSLIAALSEKIFKHEKINFSNMGKERKFLWFNIIAFGFTLLFFSSSSTKLITYILPVYIFLSYIIAYIWQEYIYENKYEKSISITTYIFGGIFIIASIAACFMKYFLPEQLYNDIYCAKWFCIILLFLSGVSFVIFTAKKKYLNVFIGFVIFVSLMSAFGTKLFYNIAFSFGQKDLIQYSLQGKQNNNNLYVVNNPRKYSVLYYGGKANYISTRDSELNNSDHIFGKNSLAIIKNKEYDEISEKYNLQILDKGRKYSLVKFISVK